MLYNQVHFDGYKKIKIDYLRECPFGDVERIAQWLIEWVRRKTFNKVVLAGYSAGGVIAIAAASKAPDLFNALILSNTGPSATGNSSTNFVEELREKGGEKAFYEIFFKNCFIVAPLPQLMDHLINYAMECPLEKAIEVSKTLRERAYDSLISKYRNPVLILWGEKDKRRTLEALKKLEWCIPQAETHLLSAGHTPMWDCPKEYSRYANNFLKNI